MRTLIRNVAIVASLAVTPVMSLAQNANVAFGATEYDASQPVEITADELTVDQATGSAVFTGNVVAGQGEMRLSAGKVRVEYAQTGGQIDKLIASGGVTLVNGAESAEARDAVYVVGSSQIVMTGEVLLTQGRNALAGEKLIVDLTTGSGQMVGRVKTIFQTGTDQ